jgi:putative membrane protein insertion efficiency factor
VNPVQHILIALVRIYRWTLSPAKMFFFGPQGQCRFTPSCSQFAMDAVKTHGAILGGWLAVKRLGRCHPWGGCGHDPVPPRVSKEKRKRDELAGANSAMISPGYSE